MSESSPVIEVDRLVTHYGARKILDQVDFRVDPGEIRVIMGGSGSGKSTLLRFLLGLHTPTAGSIRLLGRDIHRLDYQHGLSAWRRPPARTTRRERRAVFVV